MSQNEYNLLKEQLEGLTRLVNVRFENIEDNMQQRSNGTNEKLDGVNKHLAKLNGTVGAHELTLGQMALDRAENREAQKHVIGEHIATCPANEKIETIEKVISEQVVTRKVLLKTIGLGFGAATFLWVIIQIIEKLVS